MNHHLVRARNIQMNMMMIKDHKVRLFPIYQHQYKMRFNGEAAFLRMEETTRTNKNIIYYIWKLKSDKINEECKFHVMRSKRSKRAVLIHQ